MLKLNICFFATALWVIALDFMAVIVSSKEFVHGDRFRAFIIIVIAAVVHIIAVPILRDLHETIAERER